MVVESFPNFLTWITGAAGLFALILLAAVILGVFFGYVVASFRHGPFEAFYVVAQVIGQAIPDLLGTSFRRIGALARLSIKEALRRRVILVSFVIFFGALLFGGWFMNSGSDHPDRIYVNFVLWGTQLLVLMVGMLISSFSLPDDIKNKTIYTVVTKPVRATEIVLGRIVGFALLGTLLLTAMGLVSYFFVWRGLSHSHQLIGDAQSMEAFIDIDQQTKLSSRGQRVSENALMEAETTIVNGHNHRIEVIEDIRPAGQEPAFKGNIIDQRTLDDGRVAYRRLVCDPFAGHTHEVTIDGSGKISIGTASGFFRARVPVYAGLLQFNDRDGQLRDKGIDVGREWGYRGYVDGGNLLSPNSLSKAIFEFENFQPADFPGMELLPLEMTLSVFRTYIADVEKRVMASISFDSVPDDASADKFQSEPIIFETNEYQVQTIPIPRKLMGRVVSSDGTVKDQGKYDLFEDYARNGKIRLNLRCEDRNQYIGVSRADIYFRAQDDVYWINFLKGYLGIWCQMVIIIAMGVALSTFLSAPVTMLATIVMMIVGFSSPFIRELTKVDVAGGGPIESFFRLVTQKNMEINLETGVATTLMEQADKLIVNLLNAFTYLAPNFSNLNFSDFLTYGYSVDIDRLLVAVAIALAFCVGLSILGYFSLKTREIAK
jgi:hypothetical protein